MSEADGPRAHKKIPSYRIHDGFRMPLGFPVEGLASGMAYEPEPGDIFVCTYPKCGTTWTQYIIYMLVRQRVVGPGESLTDLFPHLEEQGSEAVRNLEPPRLIKTHLPVSMTPFSEAARYVVVARNPFDCAVSFYHHTRGFPKHYDFADGSFEVYFECFLAGEVDFGDYFDHLVPWFEIAEKPNVLFMTYEDMRADTRTKIIELAAFLGGIAEETAGDAAALDRLIEETSFDSMRRDQQRWASSRPADRPFVRRGAVGDWRNLFSREQARRLAEKFDRRTAGSGAAALWGDLLEEARWR
jgi:hypothetical protein